MGASWTELRDVLHELGEAGAHLDHVYGNATAAERRWQFLADVAMALTHAARMARGLSREERGVPEEQVASWPHLREVLRQLHQDAIITDRMWRDRLVADATRISWLTLLAGSSVASVDLALELLERMHEEREGAR